MTPELLTRRSWFASVLPLCFARTGEAAPFTPRRGDCVQEMLSGLTRSGVMLRSYRVHATATALGVPFFHRDNVGGGYASVETGTNAAVLATGLQFVAGSRPERCAGLNRFGAFREAILDQGGQIRRMYSGFITTSKEESLREARGALLATKGGIPIVGAWGGAALEATWFEVKAAEAPGGSGWEQADRLLAALQADRTDGPRQGNGPSAPTFLSAMRAAALSSQPSLRTVFLHNGKRYELRTHWRGKPGGEMDGQILNEKAETTARFRNLYRAGDESGLPVRIEYHPRSFLRLTFEATLGGTVRWTRSLAPAWSNRADKLLSSPVHAA